MPRTKGKNNDAPPPLPAGEVGEIAPYFRQVFKANRRFLKMRSNKLVLKMWMRDHPGFDKVPDNVKTGMAIVKSDLRSKMRIRISNEDAVAVASGKAPATKAPSEVDTGLEKLEMMIDECMMQAKSLDPKLKLNNVIAALLKARRRVVWKIGEDE
ncbi:MAG TPA: hypothetical protein VE988_03060 [Gemmataceae bacterium]|nr:hypothetical protein [Gemmataceae bacterium]